MSWSLGPGGVRSGGHDLADGWVALDELLDDLDSKRCRLAMRTTEMR
jgi:hypothetical protein